MDTTLWVWRSEAADHLTIASLEGWIARPPQDSDEHAQFRDAFAAVATETRRLRAILGHCPRAIAALDMDGNIVGYNHEFGLQVAATSSSVRTGSPGGVAGKESDREDVEPPRPPLEV